MRLLPEIKEKTMPCRFFRLWENRASDFAIVLKFENVEFSSQFIGNIEQGTYAWLSYN